MLFDMASSLDKLDEFVRQFGINAFDYKQI